MASKVWEKKKEITINPDLVKKHKCRQTMMKCHLSRSSMFFYIFDALTGRETNKKQTTTINLRCQCNATAMPPRQKQRILWENFFDAHRQGGQIKNKQQQCRANTMLMQCHPCRYICKRIFKTFLMRTGRENKLKINNSNQPSMRHECNNAMLT